MTKRTAGLAAIAATFMTLGGPVAPAPAQVRVGPNYNLASDSSKYRARDQIGLAVNRSDPQHVVGVNANYLDLECEASVSRDGGATWSDAVPLLPPAAGPGQAPYSKRCNFHQAVQFGSGQNVYAIVSAPRFAVAGGAFVPSSPDSAVILYRSTNGGATWQSGVVAMPEGAGTNDPNNVASQGPSYTRPGLAVDPGAGAGGADIVYAIGRDFIGAGNLPGGCTPTAARSTATPPVVGVSCPPKVEVAVSTDSGATFGPRIQVSPVGTDAQDPPVGVVNNDAQQSVTIMWRTRGAEGLLQAARSINQGATWGPPVDVVKVRNTARSGVDNTHLTPIEKPPTSGPLNSTTATYPRVAADPTRPGRMYLVYTDTPADPIAPAGGFLGADHFINYDATVWFQRSSDSGRTWAAPQRISDPSKYPGAQTVQTRHPNLSVSPNGRVNIVWHDRRHWYQGPGERNCTHSHIFCEDIRLGDTYLRYSSDGGTSFAAGIRVTDRSHNNDVGYDTRPAAGYWSWGPQVVTVANNQLLVGWMDSREGNWDTDTEDFYLAKVDFDAAGPVPATDVDAPDVVSRAVALSKLGYPAGNEGALVGGARDPANQNPTLTPAPGGTASRNASSVVIVNEGDVAGAMAGTVLARANPGPVLLSPADGLPAGVKEEIARIRPASIFLIGDATKLSDTVRTEAGLITGLFMPQVVRIDGGSDAGTAAAIAERLDYRTAAEKDGPALMPAFDAAVIANPESPDAAAAVGLAAARRLPILFVTQDSVPAETATALGSTALDITRTLVIGGASAVSSDVLTALPNATRLGGVNQYETSKAVVDESKARGLPSNVVYVADGAQPMDATLLGGVVARATGMLALSSAPGSETAQTQTADFGLTGISRLYRVIPRVAAAPPPPPPADVPVGVTPPPAVVPPPAGDRTAPTARLTGATTQKLGRNVSVTVTCISEPCTAVVRAKITVPRVGRTRAKTFTLKSVSVKLRKNVKRKVNLKTTSTSRLRIVRALRVRKRVSAKFTVTVSDAAANKRTLRRTVKFKL